MLPCSGSLPIPPFFNYFDRDVILIEATGIRCPIVILKKKKDKEDIMEAASLCIQYRDAGENNDVKIRINYGKCNLVSWESIR